MNKLLLPVLSLLLVISLATMIFMTNPSPNPIELVFTSTEVGGSENSASLFPPCSGLIHPDAPCDEERRRDVSKIDIEKLASCLDNHGDRMEVEISEGRTLTFVLFDERIELRRTGNDKPQITVFVDEYGYHSVLAPQDAAATFAEARDEALATCSKKPPLVVTGPAH